jgi:hypothetical protein
MDSFFFNVDKSTFNFSMSKHFTGLEWHNRIGNIPFHIRYEVEISKLAYGINDNTADPESVVYYPYNRLNPNAEGIVNQYPVTFHSFETQKEFIKYGIGSGRETLDS